MIKRTLMMLARDYDPLKFKLEAGYVSEKLDGVRALWLPFTQGMKFSQIPWANRARDDKDYTCSGFWTRRGKPIIAPEWFTNNLPVNVPLDGELFIGRKMFQKTLSTVRKHEPVDSEWENVTYKVFDIPCLEYFFRTGQIREGGQAGDPAYEVYFRSEWANLFPGIRDSEFWKPRRFSENVARLQKVQAKMWEWEKCPIDPVLQMVLPPTRQEADDVVQTRLEELHKQGAEGLMVRRGHSYWEPKRIEDLAKVKKMLDSEAQILGYVLGEGKYKGMVGAFRVRWNPTTSPGPKIFDLSGFTDRERELTPEAQRREWTPGEYTTDPISKHFAVGSPITFLYNDLTNDGIPKFARYRRKYEVL